MHKLFKVMAVIGFCAFGTAGADEFAEGYLRSDDTYVAPHSRSGPNVYLFDNYSSKGNTNPQTGATGYEQHDRSQPGDPSPYTSGTVFDFGW